MRYDDDVDDSKGLINSFWFAKKYFAHDDFIEKKNKCEHIFGMLLKNDLPFEKRNNIYIAGGFLHHIIEKIV